MKYFWRALVLVAIPMLGASAVNAQKQLQGEVKALVVEFQPGVIRVAGGPKTSSRLDELIFTNSEIATALRSAGCERITQAVSNYNPADSVVRNSYGILVKLPAFDRIFTFYFPKNADINSLQSKLQGMPGVVYAEKVTPLRPTSWDPLYPLQWGLNNTGQSGGVPGQDIGAERAWQTTTGSSNVRVGIIGATAVYSNHPDLKDRIDYNNSTVGEAHETHVAGIVGAIANNDIGGRGVDWQARLRCFVIPQDPGGMASVVVIAARDHLCNVLNNSWDSGYYTVVRQAFAAAYMLDRVSVAAMGNNGNNVPVYPAAYGQGIIPVGAMTNTGVLASYSNWGGHVDVIAPGGDEARIWLSNTPSNIMSTYYNGDTLYRYAGATSMAAPFVSGIASLLKGYRPNLCNDDIEKIISYSTKRQPPSWDDHTGWGLARADQALDKLNPPWVLDQMEVAGGTVTNQTGRLAMTFYDVPGLVDGQLYWAYRYEVQSPFVNYPHVYDQVYSWTRGSATLGFHPGNPNFGMGWCEQVNMNNQGFALRTYVYDVWDLGYNHIGWFPCEPSQVRCRFSILGIPTAPPPIPSAPTLSGSLIPCHPPLNAVNPMYQPNIGWSDPQPGIQNDYLINRQLNGQSWADWRTPVDPQNQELDDCQPSNLFPISYVIKAHNSSGWSGPSNVFTFNYPPPGDPIIANSHDSLATAYPNGQKVVLDRKDRLHVVFTSSDTVYYTSSDKRAKKWSAPVAVGLSKFPAIALDSLDSPHVLWTSVTQVLSSQLSNGNWTTPYSLFSSSGATVDAPSFAINTANDSGFASWTEATTTSSDVSLASFMLGDTTRPVSIQRVDSAGSTSFASPSLALDPSGKVLLTWSRDGVVYFQERGGTILNLSQSPGNLAIHPVVDAFGDRIAVTWQEKDSSGAFKVYRVQKEDGIWGTPQSINLFPGNALFPATAGASQVAFSSDVAGRRDIYYQGEYEDGGVIYGMTLSASSDGFSHNYPSVILDNDWPQATLNAVWTGIGGPWPLPTPKSISIQVPPVPLVFVDAGKPMPSSHTIQRAGTVSYGSQPYMTADTHPQKLIYRFSGLNPNKRYRLGVTYYFEKPEEAWRMRLKVNGRDGMRTRIPTNTRVDDSDWLPRSVYQDGVINVEIAPLEGDFALCNELALYEFDSGKGGGPQEEGWTGKPLPLTYALSQSYPNPFQEKATIAYQLPEEAPVSLKVYNVAGQVVRELASGKQKAGYYNAVWDGKDRSGRSVSSGVYFYRLDAGGFSKTNKLVVVR